MKTNKTRHRNNRTISLRKYKNIHKSRKQIKKTHKKSLLRLKKYNKNNRYRRHYTRRVNRSKRGGVLLPPISKPFNFAFPDHIQNIEFVAAGWGYVTKISSVFSQKNRPEQLIVYKNNADNETYIARCTFENCEIKKSTLTEKNMEESIQVDTIMVTSETDGSLLANVKSSDKKVYTIKPSDNNNANIRIKNITIPIPNLYKYFSTFLKADVPIVPQLPVNTTDVLPMADKSYVDTTPFDNTACIEFLQNFRINPELLGKLYSLSLSKPKNMVSKIISEHIFPLEYLVTNDDKQKSGEKQFSKALYNICFSEICNPNDISMTLREDFLFITLFRTYFEVYNVIQAIGIKTFLDSITEQSDIPRSVEKIIKLVNLKMNDLPIGVKCVFKAIKDGFDVLANHEHREKLMMTWVTQCLNVLYLRIIVPYINLYKYDQIYLKKIPQENSGPSKLRLIGAALMKVVSKPDKDPNATQVMKEGVKESIGIIENMELNCDNSDIDIEFLKGLPHGNVNPKDCDDFIQLCETKKIEFPTALQPT
jgi:hypothetical protein